VKARGKGNAIAFGHGHGAVLHEWLIPRVHKSCHVVSI